VSTSLLYHAFGVRDYRYLRSHYEGGAVTFVVEPKRAKCPCCGRRVVVRHGYRWRRLRTVPIGRRPVFVEVKVLRVHCRGCNTFGEMDPPFADPRVTYTHALGRYVADLCRVTTMQAAASFTGLSWDVVKSIERKRLQKLYSQPCLRDVRHIAVDEIAVRRGHRYMTIVADLDTGRILHVAEGKDGAALRPFLQRLRRRRKPVKAIAMDMSAAYAAAVREVLPAVPIVFDRFHVVKLMNERLDELRRAHVRDTEKAHGKLVKGVRYLVLMGAKKLEEYEKRKPGSRARLQQALAVNEPLSKGYYLKEKLRLLWEEPDRESAEDLLAEWCAEAEASGVRELKRMAKTVASHRSGILAYFDHHRITSGPLEGINNKIKTVKRMAYGYRDDEFFKLKLLGLHEARYRLVG
jgi:transposase